MLIKVKAVERNVSFDKSKEKWACVMQPELYGKLTQSKVINEASMRSGIARGADSKPGGSTAGGSGSQEGGGDDGSEG